VKRILEREQLVELAAELGVRPDWHEPDEQKVDALVRGDDFDNAGFWPVENGYNAGEGAGLRSEIYVVIRKEGQAVAAVNLATLLAWASERGYDVE